MAAVFFARALVADDVAAQTGFALGGAFFAQVFTFLGLFVQLCCFRCAAALRRERFYDDHFFIQVLANR